VPSKAQTNEPENQQRSISKNQTDFPGLVTTSENTDANIGAKKQNDIVQLELDIDNVFNDRLASLEKTIQELRRENNKLTTEITLLQNSSCINCRSSTSGNLQQNLPSMTSQGSGNSPTDRESPVQDVVGDPRQSSPSPSYSDVMRDPPQRAPHGIPPAATEQPNITTTVVQDAILSTPPPTNESTQHNAQHEYTTQQYNTIITEATQQSVTAQHIAYFQQSFEMLIRNQQHQFHEFLMSITNHHGF
jgi:hypothetical protein